MKTKKELLIISMLRAIISHLKNGKALYHPTFTLVAHISKCSQKEVIKCFNNYLTQEEKTIWHDHPLQKGIYESIRLFRDQEAIALKNDQKISIYSTMAISHFFNLTKIQLYDLFSCNKSDYVNQNTHLKSLQIQAIANYIRKEIAKAESGAIIRCLTAKEYKKTINAPKIHIERAIKSLTKEEQKKLIQYGIIRSKEIQNFPTQQPSDNILLIASLAYEFAVRYKANKIKKLPSQIRIANLCGIKCSRQNANQIIKRYLPFEYRILWMESKSAYLWQKPAKPVKKPRLTSKPRSIKTKRLVSAVRRTIKDYIKGRTEKIIPLRQICNNLPEELKMSYSSFYIIVMRYLSNDEKALWQRGKRNEAIEKLLNKTK